jgi:hypothetical protein
MEGLHRQQIETVCISILTLSERILALEQQSKEAFQSYWHQRMGTFNQQSMEDARYLESSVITNQSTIRKLQGKEDRL